jgi:hypothetical protein
MDENDVGCQFYKVIYAHYILNSWGLRLKDAMERESPLARSDAKKGTNEVSRIIPING